MAISRVSDAQTYSLVTSRISTLQVQLASLRDQVASGRRFNSPAEDAIGASTVVRVRASIATQDQYAESARFGDAVLSAEFDALREARSVLVRADEIATQMANSIHSQEEKNAAAEEVHGLLQSLTAVGNSSFGGRRLFSWLAQDASAPFTDPETPGYDPSTAYTGATGDFSIKIGDTASERVRVTTRGDRIFTNGLQALHDLEQTLRSGGDVSTSFAGLKQAQSDVAVETASVGARQGIVQGRLSQTKGVTTRERSVLSRTLDADLIATVSSLTQAQTALQALLQATSQISQQSLTNVIRF